jgi:hypothetical protein
LGGRRRRGVGHMVADRVLGMAGRGKTPGLGNPPPPAFTHVRW